jgi:peroxiredoxin
MFPHERSLVKRMEGRPFALLGINTDRTREELQKTIQTKELNWRDWWDKDGAIADAWSVDGFPCLFLIDHKGVVRRRFDGPPKKEKDLDEAIDKLVEEAEKEK